MTRKILPPTYLLRINHFGCERRGQYQPAPDVSRLCADIGWGCRPVGLAVSLGDYPPVCSVDGMGIHPG